MCIAVFKPAGQKMPSKKIFSTCFTNNDDGAGFMFPYNGKVHYEKGFMSFSAFKKGLKSAIKHCGINTKDTPMVFHFRITSQGGVKPELTHPFPLSRSYDNMRELKGDVDVACVHNGIIDFASSYSHIIDYSDTMEFIKEVAYPLIKGNAKYYENKTLMGLMSYLLTANRFAIMDKKGHVELIGKWVSDNGIFYSNESYKQKTYPISGFKSTKSVSKNLWTYDDPYYGVYDSISYISKKQEDNFLETGMLLCDCNEEMIIEWSDKDQCCYAYCWECGATYKLTNKAEAYAWEHGLVVCDFGSDEENDVRDWNASFGGAY